MVLRPYGIVRAGILEFGDELIVEDGVAVDRRSATGPSDAFIVSSAFTNAHSHLEYRGLQDKIFAADYWPWIRELTQFKGSETADHVTAACLLAAAENRRTGVAWIGEHSDRPGSAQALLQFNICGVLFQEIITFFERESPEAKLATVLQRREAAAITFSGPTYYAAHAFQTVDATTLREIARSEEPFSMHVAETTFESELTENGTGPIADFYRAFGVDVPVTGERLMQSLDSLGLVRTGAQFVHCCDVVDAEIDLLARRGVTIAHCPRSNVRLKCPFAPVRRFLEAGIVVGLGMDSAASSGAIDMFAEMRSALSSSRELGEPLTSEQVWLMATDLGYKSVPAAHVNSAQPLIKIECEPGASLDEIIEGSTPASVSWI